MRLMHHLFHPILVFFVMCLLQSVEGQQDVLKQGQQDVLKQVHVITRHGARSPLTKTASLEEGGGATLTPLGEAQHYRLGIWLRNRYGNLVSEYNATLVRLESTQYDRTMVSANSLALGMFPKEARDSLNSSLLPEGVNRANIPVYTTDRINDVTIRAYDKCPTFTNNVQELYKSSDWMGMEKTQTLFLKDLAKNPAFAPYAENGKIPLTQVWNVYDAINVAKTECLPDSSTLACQNLPDPNLASALSDSQWSELQELAHWAEYQKYGPNVAKSLIGNNLLATMVQRMQGDKGQFFLYSSHYPTILGLLSALNRGPPKIEEAIPNYATALIFEVYQSNNNNNKENMVKMLHKEGEDPDDRWVPLRFRQPVCEGSEECPVSQLEQYIQYPTLEEWCDACGNDSANVCLQAKIANNEAACTSSQENSNNSNTTGVAIGSFIGGIVAAVLVILLSMYICKARPFSEKKVDNGIADTDSTNDGVLHDVEVS